MLRISLNYREYESGSDKSGSLILSDYDNPVYLKYIYKRKYSIEGQHYG